MTTLNWGGFAASWCDEGLQLTCLEPIPHWPLLVGREKLKLILFGHPVFSHLRCNQILFTVGTNKMFLLQSVNSKMWSPQVSGMVGVKIKTWQGQFWRFPHSLEKLPWYRNNNWVGHGHLYFRTKEAFLSAQDIFINWVNISCICLHVLHSWWSLGEDNIKLFNFIRTIVVHAQTVEGACYN